MSAWIKTEMREIKTGNVSIVETKKTPMEDSAPAGATTTTVSASVKEGTYPSLLNVRNGLQNIVEALDMLIAS